MPSTVANIQSTPYVDVVVGIVQHPLTQKILITQRTSGQHLAGLWEFPGGKVEGKETLLDALNREFFEEVGIHDLTALKLKVLTHEYSEKTVKLHFFKVKKFSGTAISREGQNLKWVSVKELSDYDFPEANKPILKLLC